MAAAFNFGVTVTASALQMMLLNMLVSVLAMVRGGVVVPSGQKIWRRYNGEGNTCDGSKKRSCRAMYLCGIIRSKVPVM